MQSLFSKIFVCFWLSHLLAAALVFILLTATRPEPPPQRGQGLSREGQPPRAGGPLRRPRGRRRGGRRNIELLRLAAIFVTATGVSYGLARYLASPAAKLRRATHQLADGDLSTRVAPQMGKRRDELANLGRDFDDMAERIQSLLLSERRLLGDISHELRSPLARMQVALDLAQQSADEETRSFLLRIERESARLNDLIGQLLTFTRLETVAVESRREPIDLATLVADVAADADFEARGQNRTVRVTQADACEIAGNADLLRSAVENVVRNAVHYAPEGSTVDVALKIEAPRPGTATAGRKRDATAIITVRDYGPGVPEESLEKLFEPFYRVADARDRQSGGVGLGLSITARAVRFHRGTVAASNAPGGGLLVEIRLPVSSGD